MRLESMRCLESLKGRAYIRISTCHFPRFSVSDPLCFHTPRSNERDYSRLRSYRFERCSPRWVGRSLSVGVALLLAPSLVHAQQVTTVGQTQFRSRWANYQVDRPREQVATELLPDAGETHGITSIRSLFRNGPVVLRASVSAGLEYSDQVLQTTSTSNMSKSSLFAAPAIALLYDREVGPWNVSARYSAGYLYYLNQNFVGAGGGLGGGTNGLSQTGGLDIALKGTRLVLRSAATGSSGDGYDVGRAEQTRQLTLGETLSADYQLTEFAKLGAVGTASYTDQSSQPGGTNNLSNTGFSGRLFEDYFWTGKTGFHFEVGSGSETQNAGATTGAGFKRNYFQGLLGVNYELTAKVTFRVGVGLRNLAESGGLSSPGAPAQNSAGTGQLGFHTVYTFDADYVPTEKLTARLHFGLEGTSVKPDFSLAAIWHPRETTLVNLSIYQQTGLSTISFGEDQTSRGALASVQQRFFQKLDANLSAGIEQQELVVAGANPSAPFGKPYPYVSATVAWEINDWLAWQVQYIRSSVSEPGSGTAERATNRASTSLRLTF